MENLIYVNLVDPAKSFPTNIYLPRNYRSRTIRIAPQVKRVALKNDDPFAARAVASGRFLLDDHLNGFVLLLLDLKEGRGALVKIKSEGWKSK